MTGIQKSNEPGLSYTRAVSLFLTAEDGERCYIAKLPPGPFSVLVEIALTTIVDPADQRAARTLIADAALDYGGDTSKIDMWFALETLSTFGAALPLLRQDKEPAPGGPHRKKSRDAEPMGEAGCRTHDIQGIDPGETYKLSLPLSL